jgi:hypothetical protein
LFGGLVEVVEVIFLITLLSTAMSSTALPTDLGEIVFVEPPGWYAPFRLKMVKIAGSSWTKPQILAEIHKTNRIFRRCGIKITSLELAELNFDQNITRHNLAQFTRSLTNLGFRDPNRVLVILGPELSGERNMLGFAFHKWVSPRNDLGRYIVNSAYISARVSRFKDKPVLAHELAHVVLKSAHVDFPNLLGQPSIRSASLTATQCRKIAATNLLERDLGNHLAVIPWPRKKF